MSERSQRINKAISDSGLSYGELSKITGIPKSALQRYATGETEKVPSDRIELIAEATKVSAEYIMGWEKEKPATDKGDGLSAIKKDFIDDIKQLTDEDIQSLHPVIKNLLKNKNE